MPRYARIKPDDVGTYYHLTNRIAGMPGELPFGDVEKEKMVSLIKDLSTQPSHGMVARSCSLSYSLSYSISRPDDPAIRVR